MAKLFRGVATFVEKRGTIVFTTKSSPTDVSPSGACNVQFKLTTSLRHQCELASNSDVNGDTLFLWEPCVTSDFFPHSPMS